ncbi:MAG: alpha/beta hydrolase [Aliidongia sp.]
MLALSLFGWPVWAQESQTITIGSLQLTRCGEPQIYCGRISRPLDPAGTARIDVFFEYVPARDPEGPPAGTLVAAEGGPGFPTTGSAESYLGLFKPIMAHRDLVLMDYRGTGRSGAIDCKPLQTAPKLTAANIARCGRQLGAQAPFYSAVQDADDLAAILTALRRGPVDLYGDSYGTWFSQIFAVRHAALMRSIVLDGAYPVRPVMGESPWQPFYAPGMRDKFDKLCARDAACAGIPGSSIDHVMPALAALRAHPAVVSALDADGKRQQFRADPAALAVVMFGQSPSRTTARETDAASRAFAAGDKAPLLRLMAEAYATVDSRDPTNNPALFSEGQAAAVSCFDSEQIYDMRLLPKARAAQRDRLMAEKAAARPDLYAPFSFAEFRGLPLDYEYLDGCVGWPVPPPGFAPQSTLPDRFAYPDIPALVISGEFDDVTTQAQGAIAAAQFRMAVTSSWPTASMSTRWYRPAAPASPICAPLRRGARCRRYILCRGLCRPSRWSPLSTPRRRHAARRAGRRQRSRCRALALAAAAIATAGDAIDRLESRQGRRQGAGPARRLLHHGQDRGRYAARARPAALDRGSRGQRHGRGAGWPGHRDGGAQLRRAARQPGNAHRLLAVMTASPRVRLSGIIDGKSVAAEMVAP